MDWRPAGRCGIDLSYFSGPYLLPERQVVGPATIDARSFICAMRIESDGPLCGKRLADLPDLNPVEIVRQGERIVAPSGEVVVYADDVLMLAGPATAVLQAHTQVGLQAVEDAGEPDAIHEVVVTPRCELIGKRVGQGAFRQHYGAAVLALSRHGLWFRAIQLDGRLLQEIYYW